MSRCAIYVSLKPKIKSAETSKNFAQLTMALSVGSDWRLIHFDTARCETPMFFASVSCEMFFSFNKSLSLLPNSIRKILELYF